MLNLRRFFNRLIINVRSRCFSLCCIDISKVKEELDIPT